ncbi:MAG: tetratricopeptide repeat protein [Planctomycetota bacterium]
MELRKEQILFILALVVGAVIYTGREDQTVRSSANPKDWLEFTPPPAPLPEMPGLGEVGLRGLLFREPTEAIPLPPRDLPTPRLEDLPVVYPPLPIGQRSGAMHQLVASGVTPTAHSFSDYEPESGVVLSGPVDTDPESDPFFDKIWQEGRREPLIGRVVDQDPFSLENAVPNRKIKFQFYDRDRRVPQGQPIDIEDATRVRLADSLDNRIERRRRSVERIGGVEEREPFLEWLLEQARTEPRVYTIAETQAERLLNELASSELGHLWTLRVLRAQGDAVREFEFYRKLDEQNLSDVDYIHRERGRLAARLTLDELAEKSLRRAVELRPRDAANLSALGDFLLARGRLVEARSTMDLALSVVGTLSGAEARSRVYAIAVEAYLAVGELEAASSAFDRVGAGLDGLRLQQLRGALAYAKGELSEAITVFEELTLQGDGPSAFALGAAALRAGNFDQARYGLQRAANEAPLLRGRAFAAMSVLYELTGHDAEATDAMQRAVTASPDDFYVLYLAGRRLRLDGDPVGSLESLRRLLSERDDFGMALAESVRALFDRAIELGAEGGQALADAARYADSLVELDGSQSDAVLFLEMQGLAHSQAGNLGPSRRAWRSAAERGSDFGDLGLAILDYRSGRARLARERLVPITSDPSRLVETKQFALETIQRIDDHAAKEQVLDDFDRDSIGEFWQRDGSLRPTIADGRVAFQNNDSRREEGSLTRDVPGSDFLSVAATLEMKATAGTGFAGLHLELEGKPFSIDIGYTSTSRVGGLAPRLVIEDGRNEDGPQAIDLSEVLSGVSAIGEHRLEIEAIPVIDAETGQVQTQLGLVLRWNGREIHRIEKTRSLRTRGNSKPMRISMRALGSGVDLRFDDFRLVRRRSE